MIDQPIVRLYRTAEHAARALAAVRRWGFERERLLCIGPPQHAERDEIVAMLRAASIPAASARRYADAIVDDGLTLLAVRAPFGTGGHTEDLLAEGAPVALEPGTVGRYLLPSDLAAPLSRTLGVPTLSRRGRTLSEALGLPSLVASGRTTSEALGIPTLTRNRPFVTAGPRRPDDPAPLSRWLHLPVLARQGRTLGTALGLPEVVRDDPDTSGVSRQSDSPAPFSRLLHLPVLLRDRVAGRAHPRVVARPEVRRGDMSPTARDPSPPRAAEPAPRSRPLPMA